MPTYDYRCPFCSKTREVTHGMTEAPQVACECGGPMRKRIGGCNFIVRNTISNAIRRDSARRDSDMKAELRESYGIHNFTPLHGATTADVLRDVKNSGTLVKDKMDYEIARNEKRRLDRLKEWKPKAQKRATKRRLEMRERKAAEAAAKRKIIL